MMVQEDNQKPNPLKKHLGKGNPNWIKGVSGNPLGKPRAYLTKAVEFALTPERAAEIAETLIYRAVEGDMAAIQLLWNRLEGRELQRIEAGSPGSFSRMDALSDDALRTLLDLARSQLAQQATIIEHGDAESVTAMLHGRTDERDDVIEHDVETCDIPS